jgi:ATP-dependent Lhr-like helicase
MADPTGGDRRDRSAAASAPSAAFELYHPLLQRWVWEQRWTELRDAQERAAAPILRGERDVVIASATASGKTEAAFLPIVSRLLGEDRARGVQVLYVAPLRALINDQYERLSAMCDAMDVPIARWHGDVAASQKAKLVRNPSGILLITPESLEALFVRRGTAVGALFQPLRYVVVDELHAFIGSERGRQLQSLLDRLGILINRRVPRIGLSATIGDLPMAARYLRPPDGGDALIIDADDGSAEVRIGVRGYRSMRPAAGPESAPGSDEPDQSADDADDGSEAAISRAVFDVVRHGHHLVFANSRGTVERYTDMLRRWAAAEGLPNAFFPHHGSLSREIREEAESRMKDPSRPATTVCTVTLELGIDLGSVETIVQIGPPASVSSLRQRLGRSGRRGQPAVLRVFVTERGVDADTPIQDSLRSDLVQTIAVIRLLAAGWCEPPTAGDLHLSTMVQQVLSVIAEYGGVRPDAAWRVLAGHGPFCDVAPEPFADLLRSLGRAGLVTQMDDGTLLLDEKGERMVGHYSFYAAFETAEEFRVVFGTRVLGSLTIQEAVAEGSLILFAGRRWQVVRLDPDRRTIEVSPAAGGRVPQFGGEGAPVHARVREEMHVVYRGTDVPPFLDPTAAALLAEGRSTFSGAGLDRHLLREAGDDVLLFPWSGDCVVNTLAVQLRAMGFRVVHEGLSLRVANCDGPSCLDALGSIARGELSDSVALAATVGWKQGAKWDWTLSESLLDMAYAGRDLDVDGAAKAAARTVAGG